MSVGVTQHCGGFTWDVPFVYTPLSDANGRACSYPQASRQICPQIRCPKNGEFSLSFTTLADEAVEFVSSTELVNSTLPVCSRGRSKEECMRQDAVEVEVSPWRPQYLTLVLGDDGVYTNDTDTNGEIFELFVESDDELEAIVSIQNVSCPVLDLPQNVKFRGLAQAVSKKGALRMSRKDVGNVVYVVLVLVGSDKCSNKTSTFRIVARPAMSSAQYWVPLGGMLGGFFGISAVVAFFFFLSWRRRTHRAAAKGDNVGNGTSLSSPSPSSSSSGSGDGGNDGIYEDDDADDADDAAAMVAARDDPLLQLTKSTWDFGVVDRTELKKTHRGVADLRLSQLARKPPRVLWATGMGFIYYLSVITLFYLIPVFQFVNGFLLLFKNGNEDLCYFNFQCARPLWGFVAFNNIASNAGYIILGLVFIGIVRSRKPSGSEVRATHDAGFRGTTAPEDVRGAHSNRGLFYCVGLAMIGEGLFSATYHICPNPVNFQFDTTFMYTIAVLIVMAVYQRRHPDVAPKPHHAYIAIAVLILMNVLGVYWAKPILVYFYLMVLALWPVLSYHGSMTYYMVAPWRCILFHVAGEDGGGAGTGNSGEGGGGPTGTAVNQQQQATREQSWVVSLKHWRRFGIPPEVPWRRRRLALVVLCNGLTWLVLLFGLILHPADVPTFFLALVVLNLAMYFSYYIVMKLACKERLAALPVVCFVLAFGFTAPALYYFQQPLMNWDLGPAGSRELNHPCVVLDFFDYHDIWHMFSALGMFFLVLLVLTVDDDVSNVRRAQIKVF
jgi:hypothetical protein